MQATPELILSATIDLFREFGYNGTSLKQIVDASGTTTGSVYHFFPGGKDELAAEAILYSGPLYQQIMEEILDEAEDLATGIYRVFEQASITLHQSGYMDPCPIGGIAREVANVKPPLRRAASSVFGDWTEALADRIRACGLHEAAAQDLAVTIVSSIEGGFILARSHRSREPLLQLGRTFQQVFLAHGLIDTFE